MLFRRFHSTKYHTHSFTIDRHRRRSYRLLLKNLKPFSGQNGGRNAPVRIKQSLIRGRVQFLITEQNPREQCKEGLNNNLGFISRQHIVFISHDRTQRVCIFRIISWKVTTINKPRGCFSIPFLLPAFFFLQVSRLSKTELLTEKLPQPLVFS